MKSYIAHVSSWKLLRALNIEIILARPVIIQFQLSLTELPLKRIKLFFHSKKIRLMCQVLTHCGFSGMETAPTSIEVILCPTLGQSDEPSDSRGSTAPGNPRQTPIQSWTEPSVAQLQ